MEFEVFSKKAYDQMFWKTKNLFCFQAHTYPFTFFTLLLKQLENKSLLPYQLKKINLDPSDHQKLIPLINQSMLGSYFCYWLSDFALQTKEKQRQQLIPFLASYTGPHTIMFFIDHETATAYKKNLEPLDVINLKNNLHWVDFQLFLTFFNQQLSTKKQHIAKKIFDQNSTLSLDFSCMLMQYLELINPKSTDEFFHYISAFLPYQPSLSLLSESFFAKNAHQFFKTWSILKDHYSDMFWIAYWSELLWKAYHVITLLQQQQFSKAKKMSYRLPFSFIQRDWKNFSQQSLITLHNYLYMSDFMIKNGSAFCSLDFFYFTHFYNNRLPSS